MTDSPDGVEPAESRGDCPAACDEPFRRFMYLGHVIYIYNEQERSKDATLWNSVIDRFFGGIFAINTYKLLSIMEIGFDPVQCNALDTIMIKLT